MGSGTDTPSEDIINKADVAERVPRARRASWRSASVASVRAMLPMGKLRVSENAVIVWSWTVAAVTFRANVSVIARGGIAHTTTGVKNCIHRG